MVKLSLLLALAENVLSQNDDEDLTLASGDYEIEASGEPISRSIQADQTTVRNTLFYKKLRVL